MTELHFSEMFDYFWYFLIPTLIFEYSISMLIVSAYFKHFTHQDNK